LLVVFPGIAPLARVVATLVAFLGVWLGTAQAHQLRGWRTLLLPVLYIIVVAIVAVILDRLLMGAALTLESLWAAFGM
jgi:hypothetical protein